ncbi:MAG: hypothetical protein LIO56_06075 [Lachnospiraceae bacterium]|nr:hypothetical protein [Lachnospiraceae bacterium]
MAYQIKPGGLRLPCIQTDEEVDQIEWLSDEEKKFAKLNLKKVPSTEGWRMLGNDPYTQAFWQFIERFNTAIQNDKGQHQMQSTPCCFLSICHMIVSKRSGNEYMLGVIGSCLVDSVEGFKTEFGIEKMFLMIDHPESALWNDEERLCINFINALYDYSMTDEIFQEALDTWGEQQTIRNISWFAYVLGWGSLLSALNMKFDSSMTFRGVWTPESIAHTTDNLQPVEDQFAEFWGKLSDFDQVEDL